MIREMGIPLRPRLW